MKKILHINKKIIFSALGASALIAGTLFAVDGLVEKVKPSGLARQKVEYHTEGARDPFKPLKIEMEESVEEEGPQTLPDLKIQGVVWGGSFPQAIINNKVVKVGETIDKAKVIDINKDGITVLFSGRKYNIYSPAAANLAEAKKKKTKGGVKDEK
ncbi:MAG: hypothetical protein PHT31_06170 [Candidatus Omnitrophica bacterium]|nr:hypothetical protein [Candidatus Omnitrophota bacterium]MDD5653724.1 hypothetical protein [Candidatus Omnitrophota bacterium]